MSIEDVFKIKSVIAFQKPDVIVGGMQNFRYFFIFKIFTEK